MNGFLFAGVAGIIILGLMAVYFAMVGVKANLADANIGQVYTFDYVQPYNGDRHRFMAKVLDVTKLDSASINRLNRRSRYRYSELMNGDFQRSHHLVTCQTKDGKIRNFYAERTVNCRRPLITV